MAKKEGSIRITKDNKVEINKHKTVSPYNSAKHLKYAKLPAECDKCIYRSEEEGGTEGVPSMKRVRLALYERTLRISWTRSTLGTQRI
jgi:hypothetical protein